MRLPAALVALDEDGSDLSEWNVTPSGRETGPANVQFPAAGQAAWRLPRTLHDVHTFDCGIPYDVVATVAGKPCWIRIRIGGTAVLVIGSDLGGDLIRFRQGDPARVKQRTDAPMWGIAGERPIYLFENQIPAGSEHERPVDWWMTALAEAVDGVSGKARLPIVPDGMPGVVVVTGDDDQAELEKYDEQLSRLRSLPATYFLHPQTRHTGDTMRRVSQRHAIEWQLHPDALDRPTEYSTAFDEQAAWFRRLTGRSVDGVRNHGYLNDGYWGHLPSWLAHGVTVSANLPGVDGRILNGSLLPARVAWQDQLTPHWSILTAVGDGVRFALGMNGPQSAECVFKVADRIVDSRVPGVLVLNLHPQNVSATTEMHEVLHEITGRLKFGAWSLSQCIEWFARRDDQLAGAA